MPRGSSPSHWMIWAGSQTDLEIWVLHDTPKQEIWIWVESWAEKTTEGTTCARWHLKMARPWAGQYTWRCCKVSLSELHGTSPAPCYPHICRVNICWLVHYLRGVLVYFVWHQVCLRPSNCHSGQSRTQLLVCHLPASAVLLHASV